MSIMDWRNEVYKIVQRIPKGRVSTYGGIAEIVGTSPRAVGKVLHRNPDPEKIPCHRVVSRDGRLAGGYAFGGVEAQKKKLLAEGVKFKDEKRVARAFLIFHI